jgi:phosphoribosylanthranilate isomerase
LGLSALVEAHDEAEVAAAVAAGARMIGVNNRNLKDFTVDIHNSMRLRQLVPENVVFVAESGIKTGADIEELRSANVNGVLIGETLMRAKDKTRMLNELRGTKVKICGLRREEDIAMVNELQPDYIGFVFAPSKRQVTDAQAKQLRAMLDDRVRAKGRLQVVGVFVNDSIEHIRKLCEDNVIDAVQLHGDEDVTYVEELKAALEQVEADTHIRKRLIRAIRVQKPENLVQGADSSADYVLLDTYHKDVYGGTGEVFDTGLIPEGYRPYFLAGGISAENVQDKIRELRPYAVDVSSSVEADGYKDYDKVNEFIKKVRETNE